MPFRDFIRGAMPADIIQLFDGRTHKEKGIFISPKYANDVLLFIKEREQAKKEAKKRALLDFIGEFGEIETGSHQAIKAKKYE